MMRYLAGAASALLLVAAGVFLFRSSANTELQPRAASVQRQAAVAAPQATDPDTAPLPEASAKTREEKRFGRYDKDRDGQIARDEYLAARRKAFAKLDSNGDGRLSFDEWAAKIEAKFAAADHDRSGALTAAEFATTAVKRTSRRVPCPPAAAPASSEE